MKPSNHLTITMPDLAPETAYAFMCWLECLTHEVSLHYHDEIRREIIRQEQDHAGEEDFNDPIPF